MSELLISALLILCPQADLDHKGQVTTNSCHEWMVNCIINKADDNGPTDKEFNACANQYREKIRLGRKIISSDLSDE